MSEWWTYGLHDLLLFSPRTYYRLFELYHRDLWPAQLTVPVLGGVFWWLARHGAPRRGRAAAALLAVCWFWVAWAFHWQRYAAINWAAPYFAAAFASQGLALAWSGARGRLVWPTAPTALQRAGRALFLYALCLHPLAGLLAGRDWRQLELFGLTPDPTVLATLGLLLAARRAPRHLFAIPLAWCAIGAATLWALAGGR